MVRWAGFIGPRAKEVRRSCGCVFLAKRRPRERAGRERHRNEREKKRKKYFSLGKDISGSIHSAQEYENGVSGAARTANQNNNKLQ